MAGCKVPSPLPLTATWIHSIHIQPRVLSSDIIWTRHCSHTHRGGKGVPTVIRRQVVSIQRFIDIKQQHTATNRSSTQWLTSVRAEINIKGGSGGGASQDY